MPNKLSAGDYVVGLLQMNPVEQAEAILRERNCFLGIETTPVAEPLDEVNASGRRSSLQELITALRQSFWTTPLPQLQHTLDSLDAREFPDMEVAVRRLRHLASVRQQFRQLTDHKRTCQPLLNAFMDVVVLPPREAGAAKERALQALVATRYIKPAKRMVRMLQSEFPQLVELEPDWLNQVSKLRKGDRAVHITNAGSGLNLPLPGWVIWIILIIIVRIVAALARMGE
jgi:hypothetical protein